MKKILIISLILGLAIAGLFAQMHMMGNKKGAMNHQGKGPMMNCMDELNLTDAQITKFAEARAAFQKQENVLSAEIENLRIDAMAAMKAEDFKRVKEIQKTISDKELMIKNAHVDMMAAHMKELSKEQKQIMQKNMPMMMGMMAHGGNGMHQGMHQGMKQGMGHGMRNGNCDDCDDCDGEPKFKNRKE